MYPTQVDPRNPRIMLAIGGMAFAVILMSQIRSPPAGLGVASVTTTQAKELIDQGALVVDVRGPKSFATRHIAGALHFPVESLRQTIPQALSKAKTDSIVVYCGDGETLGPEGTAVLNRAGFAKAVNLKGGIPAWAKAGLPVEKSAPNL